ncbi:2-keto-4-pentenoate hydratase/2-oxohepta-3-ene-1,7-dioic acid hydratase in catechol pathway [Pseudonocardia hierapolitana]|uniref:2-keto-4-pentenoate hydratase/2-oxohepta-3-ene-1,7-dioic acid hydratase in catechol pathway n=1 Tax=Pseudonocardia hierapolitana TaxID=1128676 RepID=A0A561SZW4_9PSEU|nr:fumarylacetoacetate hydrolase family protein [Pseudonocardia hierapolitana]TWF80391.1 2-keto-4-pentenoate hydratase/2-oxohepta-3-ene-1,7-dioic acid hydratase in catechol pathway [Pseudonocardia hierapolitana]
MPGPEPGGPDAVTAALGRRPGKVVAVHLNYPSRAAQRGRTPTAASYFLKPSSSLTGSGSVEKPGGTELLAFEGEIALVIGSPARHVRPEDGWAHVGWVTAANDLGLQDLRTADRGSNVRSKGGDGYTPLGPALLPAAELDPADLRIRTWLDGELVQDDTSATLLFEFGHLVADLSRMLTLEEGDVILTGTPAGASVAQPGQVVEVEVGTVDGTRSTGLLRTAVVEGPPLAPWGSPAHVDDAVRADAWGTPPPGPPGLSAEIRERLHRVAVATLSVQLRKRGFDDASIDGVRPLVPGRRLVGTARTLRYVPFRPDLFAAHGGGYNAQKRAVDSIGPGEVLVMEARRDPTAGTLGDILALRAQVRGAAGIITDGAARDAAAVAAIDLPVYTSGQHPAVLGRRHVPWEGDVTIACGGATVQVGDVIVADDDGVVVIPPGLVEEVLGAAEQQEREEAWIAARVAEGAGLQGLYPLSGPWRDRYDAEQAPS